MKSIFKVLFYVSFIGISELQAQNISEQLITDDRLTKITINADQIFEVRIRTHRSDDIRITSILDGEYQNYFQVVSQIKKHQLFLGLEPLMPDQIPDDKRNAHKVIAAILDLEIPNTISLEHRSDIGSLEITGNLKSFDVQLDEGNFKITGNALSGDVKTITGHIECTTNARVRANSKNGLVAIDQGSLGEATWQLNSIHGNITVKFKE